jgi:hypothetical protein
MTYIRVASLNVICVVNIPFVPTYKIHTKIALTTVRVMLIRLQCALKYVLYELKLY